MRNLKFALAIAGALLLSCAAQAQTVIAPTKNNSTVIVAGNTFQNVLAAVTVASSRRSLTIQNNNTSDVCWIYVGSGTATKAASIMLASGQAYTRYYPYIPLDLIQATCTTTADTLYVDVQ
jgi:heme/copper-type cytochrome/quinol oxidase subunit 1